MVGKDVRLYWKCIPEGAYKMFDELFQRVYTSHLGQVEIKRPWIQALGHLSNSLSERDPAEQLARARIDQVDRFSRMEPSIIVLSLRWFG